MIKEMLVSGNLSKLRSDLIGKSSDENGLRLKRQKELADSAIDPDSRKFINYFKSHCKTETLAQWGNDSTPPPRNRRLTESELFEPPQDTEEAVFNSLRNLPQRLASYPAFWTSYHLDMIESGLVEPSYFAKVQISETGQARTEKALALVSVDEKPLDRCVRTILRRMGGLPEARGSVSVFQDCRTARSWWRGLFVDEVCGELGTDRDRAWKVLRTNQIWEQLTGYVVQKLTVLGDKRIRIALIAYFAEMDSVPNERDKVQDILNRIGRRTAYQMMGVLSPRENLEIIRSICRES